MPDSRKRRKQRQRAARVDRPDATDAGGPQRPADGGEAPPSRRERSARRDAEARAALEPLPEGERPAAVTVAAVLALALGVGNIGLYLAGVEIQGEPPALGGVLVYTALMLAAAYGAWRARYWAVLGIQALLAIRAESALALLIAFVVVAAAGSLFWFLVKAMARIQMPERPR
jgi:hypothetical protein